MIGLLDLPEYDRATLLSVADGFLAWYPQAPKEWGLTAFSDQSVWVWMDPTTNRPYLAVSPELVKSVYRLQRADLVTPTVPRSAILPTREGATLIHWLHLDGWQPFDRVPPAAPVAVRKPSPRARKKRAS